MAIIGTDVLKAASIIKEGGLVAIPTETVYGLAANALNELAVTQIFKVKNRPFFDPLIIHVSGIEDVSKYVSVFPLLARKLAETFWPGPLTLVLPKSNIVDDLVTAGSRGVAIRVPSHPLTLELLKLVNLPLAAPSANPFGYVSPTSAIHVNNQLGNALDYILDGGDCSVGLESTVVSFLNDKPVVLRLGGLKIESLRQIIPDIEINIASHSNPHSPGQTDKHYSPETKFILCNKITQKLLDGYEGKIGCIYFSEPAISFNCELEIVLSKYGDADEAARNLFSAIRKADDAKLDFILAEKAPESGLGFAINDRLSRASHQ